MNIEQYVDKNFVPILSKIVKSDVLDKQKLWELYELELGQLLREMLCIKLSAIPNFDGRLSSDDGHRALRSFVSSCEHYLFLDLPTFSLIQPAVGGEKAHMDSDSVGPPHEINYKMLSSEMYNTRYQFPRPKTQEEYERQLRVMDEHWRALERCYALIRENERAARAQFRLTKLNKYFCLNAFFLRARKAFYVLAWKDAQDRKQTKFFSSVTGAVYPESPLMHILGGVLFAAPAIGIWAIENHFSVMHAFSFSYMTGWFVLNAQDACLLANNVSNKIDRDTERLDVFSVGFTELATSEDKEIYTGTILRTMHNMQRLGIIWPAELWHTLRIADQHEIMRAIFDSRSDAGKKSVALLSA